MPFALPIAVLAALAGSSPPAPRAPFTFVENRGQWSGPAQFVARGSDGATVFLAPDALWLSLSDAESLAAVNLRLGFEAANADVRLVGRERTATLHHFFVGNDPARWRASVASFAKVAYEGLHDGIDLVVREEAGALEYDLVLAPGADLGSAVVRVEGACEPLRLDADGALVAGTALGDVRQSPPRAWEETEEGGRRPLACSFRILGPDRFGFDVPTRDAALPLVVDPQLRYATYLGGGNDDSILAAVFDGDDEAILAGRTFSPDFPTTPGAYNTTVRTFDAFVTRISLAGGPPIESTFLGGGNFDSATAIALDPSGEIVVAGSTASTDFPTTPGSHDTTFNGGGLSTGDAFVTRLAISGSGPSYSTFLGGGGVDEAFALVLDAVGSAVVAGSTTSFNFPTTPSAVDTALTGFAQADAFVTVLPLGGGAATYSTFLGGAGAEVVSALALDATGAAVLAGSTGSTDFPTTAGAFDTTFNGGSTPGDGFVARLPFMVGIPYSTYFGGSAPDDALDIALDATGAAVLSGRTMSPNLPVTPGAFDTSYNGGAVYGDAFVARLSFAGGAPSYATYLGGTGEEYAQGVAVAANGDAIVAGNTSSVGFPTTVGALDTTVSGHDFFAMRLPLSGAPPFYSTVYGGTGSEIAVALALDASEAALVAGITTSNDFPTTPGAVSSTIGNVFGGGIFDGAAALLELLPIGASTFGASSPGCAGPLPIGATSMPEIGNGAFAVTCGHAPASAAGVLASAAAPLSTPIAILGADLWIDLFSLNFVPAVSNAIGASVVVLPIPPDPFLVGGQVYFQFAWVVPTAPPPCPALGISASNALEVTLQP